jgi:hypothetical protein
MFTGMEIFLNIPCTLFTMVTHYPEAPPQRGLNFSSPGNIYFALFLREGLYLKILFGG